MEPISAIHPGLNAEASFVVEERHLAPHLGSGSARVLATPALIAWMERTAHQLLEKHLPEGYSSVGTRVDVRHLAPTPLGSPVLVEVVVLSIDGIQVTFDVQARDDYEQIGVGQHTRVVIEESRFLKRVAKKSDSVSL